MRKPKVPCSRYQTAVFFLLTLPRLFQGDCRTHRHREPGSCRIRPHPLPPGLHLHLRGRRFPGLPLRGGHACSSGLLVTHHTVRKYLLRHGMEE